MSAAPLQATRIRAAWWLLSPLLATLGLVAGWPLLRTIWLGFTDAQLGEMETSRLIGLGNYLGRDDGGWTGLLVDPDWWRAVGVTLRFTLVSVTLETLLGLAVALVLHRRFPGRGLVRAAVLVPWAIPTVVSARTWSWLLHDQFGLLNDLLLRVGLIAQPIAWTADADAAFWAVVIADVWKSTPFMALLILAALQMIPQDCYEAARLDGIRPVQAFLRITLPLIRPALVVAVLFRTLDALRVFDIVYVLTPATRETQSMAVYARMYLSEFQEDGYGSAAATLLFLTIAVLTALGLTAARVRVDAETAR